MILFEQVGKTFDTDHGQVVALQGLNLFVAEGETLCLIGTSGSGKTTALKLINRLIEPTHGRIALEGKDIRDLDPISLRRGIGYVIQRSGLFPHMSVAANIGLLCRLEGWPHKRIGARVDELLELVNLAPKTFARRKPRALSGGQQQRVGVARALALDPDVVLMDEPFGALDPITRTDLHGEFLNLKKRVGKTIVLVTHDLAEAFKLGDRIAPLDHGKLVQVGTEQELRTKPINQFARDFVGSHLTGGAP